jgi:hypothetical protein
MTDGRSGACASAGEASVGDAIRTGAAVGAVARASPFIECVKLSKRFLCAVHWSGHNRSRFPVRLAAWPMPVSIVNLGQCEQGI